MRILIVEDNPINLELARQILEEEHEILAATDGQEAVEIALQGRPDVILMDLSLPRLSGWDALTLLRQSEETRRTPTIALTAHAVKGDREKAIEAGFDGYVSKPIDEDVLRAKLREIQERAKVGQ